MGSMPRHREEEVSEIGTDDYKPDNHDESQPLLRSAPTENYHLSFSAAPSRADSFHIECPAPRAHNSTKVPSWHVIYKVSWTWELLGISLVYFVEGFLDMNYLAVQYFLKDTLQLSPAAAGYAETLIYLPWDLSILMGLTTDTLPLLGYHRKAYMLLVGLLGCCCQLLLLTTHSYLPAIVLLMTQNVCEAWTQVIADAVVVKLSQGQDQDVAAFYQALSWGTYTLGALMSGWVGGMLLGSTGPTGPFLVAAGGLFLDACCALLIHEHPEQARRAQRRAAQQRQRQKQRQQGKSGGWG
eukprot:CAMPEP_0202907730 /NCGR_PEP_ID=MMETSP1392-20130828/43653_1 /ASSEMBLY_ACC=CAM_ASM_000868 /TAXON_ID=225041 /ORGANISM="Chlamydomonas chlamydogama, Strain SAG 11-48b" /LENGTH=296 /DNA_ID=CAMNT_0049596761 /DNA_START=201 /DNA_END=1087 /DNA_ORIENTATION=+